MYVKPEVLWEWYSTLSAADCRAKLREAVDEWRTVSRAFPNHAVIDAIKRSPICGDGERQLKARPQWSWLRDNLPTEVLLALLLGLISWTDVLLAISEPDTFAYPSSSTKTGYVFGRPCWLSESNVSAMIRGLETEAKKGPTHMTATATATTVAEAPAAEAKPAANTEATLNDLTLSEQCDAFDHIVRERVKAKGLDPEADAEAIKALAESTLTEMRHKYGEENSKALASLIYLRDKQGTTPKYDTDLDLTFSANAAGVISAMLGSMPAKVEEPLPAAPTKTAITIDTGFAVGINAMLSSATKGQLSDISALLKAVDDAADAVAKRDELIAELRKKVSAAARTGMISTAASPVSGSGMIPSGNVVWKNANDVFRSPTGRKQKLLDFEIPTFEWDGVHPHVPNINEHYKFKPGKLAGFLWGIVLRKNQWFHGHTGTGKTTFVEQAAARMGYPVHRINFDSEIGRMDLIGRDVLRAEGGTTKSEFIEGIIPTAMQQPCILLCDELDFIRPDVAYVFQRLLEEKGLLLNEDGGRLIVPHPMFRIVATANTKGQGDEFGAYQGARPQSQALLDRFQAWIEIEYLKKDDEKQLLIDVVPGIDPDIADQIVNLATEIRQGFIQGDICQTVSPRGLISLAENVVFFSPLVPSLADAVEFGLDLTILGKATAQDRQRIKEYVSRTIKAKK